MITISSVAFVACGGEDDKEKESKKKEESGWKIEDKDTYLEDCVAGSGADTVHMACDCALGVAEDNFDSYKGMMEWMNIGLGEDADKDDIEAYNKKLHVMSRAMEDCFKDLFDENLDSQYGDLDDGNYFANEPKSEHAGSYFGDWEGVLLGEHNLGSAAFHVEDNGTAKLNLSGSFDITHTGYVDGNNFISTSANPDQICPIVKLDSGFRIVLKWTGVNVDVYLN